MVIFEVFTYFILIGFLATYLITNLQWYNYKINRVIFHHHKIEWHLIYFITPFTLYYLLDFLYFATYFFVLFVPTFYFWYKKLDKKVVLTGRVKRFFAILGIVSIAITALCIVADCNKTGIFLPLMITHIISVALEKIFFLSFKDTARKRLESFNDLKIVAITASFGKTSTKNYMDQVLSKKFKTYKTPRSVNTIGGIVKDVNDDLPADTQIYIVEAGAREKGDIEEIALFLNPQYVVIGSVGRQHIEYFKTLDNIIHTKMEILKSKRLLKGFVHTSVPILDYPNIIKFPDGLNITMSNLDGIWFDLVIDGTNEHFHAPLLGSFNAINLSAVILVARELGMSIDEIKVALHDIKPVDHRLKLSKVNGKLILDDSFNGNLEGMLEAVRISSTYEGRKVIITPGIVESTEEENRIFAEAVEKTFDLVIITGSLNQKILSSTIKNTQVIYLANKNELQTVLSNETRLGDLILFANDAPNFI